MSGHNIISHYTLRFSAMPPNLDQSESSDGDSLRDGMETYDATGDFTALQLAINSHQSPIIIPISFQRSIREIIALLQPPVSNLTLPMPPPILEEQRSEPPLETTLETTPDIYYNVKVNHKTTLDRLYVHHSPNPIIEYPETSNNGVGYLIRMEWNEDSNPTQNFAYSLGGIKGKSKVTNITPWTDTSTPTPFHLFHGGRMIVPHTTTYSACRFLFFYSLSGILILL